MVNRPLRNVQVTSSISGEALEPVQVAAAVGRLLVERLFDRPAQMDDTADGLDDGERVVVAGV